MWLLGRRIGGDEGDGDFFGSCRPTSREAVSCQRRETVTASRGPRSGRLEG
ncbi:hypothetical protein A33M_0323 [Rhodovulum sp. PH10]|nr:hypothetical protein A33M_0323 [Rhodovulum sp. PH10]